MAVVAHHRIIALERWRVFRVKSPSKLSFYAVGYTPHNDDVLVSGAIKLFDPSGFAQTDKGERIQLTGKPGETRDATRAWEKFCKNKRIEGATDASQRFMPKKAKATA